MNEVLAINTTPASDCSDNALRPFAHSLRHGDRVKFAHPRRSNLPGNWLFGKVGTIAGYALQDNSCPLEAIARAKKNGHSTNPWINQECTMITNDVEYNRKEYERKMDSVVLKDGDRVYIEGRLGTVKFQGDYSDMASIVLDNRI